MASEKLSWADFAKLQESLLGQIDYASRYEELKREILLPVPTRQIEGPSTSSAVPKEGRSPETQPNVEQFSDLNYVSSDDETKPSVPREIKLPEPQLDGEQVSNSDDDEEYEFADAQVLAALCRFSLMQKIVRRGIIESKHNVQLQRKNPNSRIYSVQNFGVCYIKPKIIRAALDMKFSFPSKIQKIALPTLLEEPPQNVILESPPGSGKTSALLLVMLTRIDPRKNYPQGLYLIPSYELAYHVKCEVSLLTKYYPEINIRLAAVDEEVDQDVVLEDQIIIGNPDVVLDWAFNLKLFDLKKIDIFALDETDLMTNDDMDHCLQIRREFDDNQCQIMFTSAISDKIVKRFAESIVPNPITIILRQEENSLDNVKQYYVDCENREAKYTALAILSRIPAIGQTVVICDTNETANWLWERYSSNGRTPMSFNRLSSGLSLEENISILHQFRQKKVNALIITDSYSESFTIEQKDTVINFDIPMNEDGMADLEKYLYRVGRISQFRKTGFAINLVEGLQSKNALAQIQRGFGDNICRLNPDDLTEMERLLIN